MNFLNSKLGILLRYLFFIPIWVLLMLLAKSLNGVFVKYAQVLSSQEISIIGELILEYTIVIFITIFIIDIVYPGINKLIPFVLPFLTYVIIISFAIYTYATVPDEIDKPSIFETLKLVVNIGATVHAFIFLKNKSTPFRDHIKIDRSF